MNASVASFTSWSLEYLANALWQVPLVYFAALLLTQWTRRSDAQMEHRIWVGALLLEPVLPALSTVPARFLWWFSDFFRLRGDVETASGGARVSVSFGDGSLQGSVGLPMPLLRGLEAVYLAAVVFFSLQLLWGLWRTHELRAGARDAEGGDGVDAWMDLYRRRFGVPEAGVAISAMAGGPLTVGVRRRLLILPERFGSGPEEDVRAALAHEFAHMGRQDFAKNLLYRLLTLPVAFHPALRATLAQVAATREMVCDGLAAEAVAGSTRYAKSLLRLASRFAGAPPNIPLHAIGIFGILEILDANTLERRITMLTAGQKKFGIGQKLALGVTAGALAVGAFSSAMAFRLHVFAGEPQTASAAPTGPVRISGGVMAGQVLTKVNPVYPEDAKTAKITGAVVLHAVIGKTGAIESLELVSGPPELTQSAWDAVKQWMYTPFLLNGEPTEVTTTITVNFQLNP